MAQTQEAAQPPKPTADERLDALEKAVAKLQGVVPPHKETVTAYYKVPPFKAEPEGKDESPKDKAAREARDKAAKERAGKTEVYELPPIVYEEAKNGRVVMTELPHPVDDGAGHQKLVVAKWSVPDDADAWSLEDPDKKKGSDAGAHPAARGK